MKKIMLEKNKFVLSLAVCAGLVLSSCGTTAPFKDRDAALTAIERSETVEAPVYAQELHENSKGEYDQGQGLIVEDKKSGQNTKAKQFYVRAKKIAQDAYAKAIGPFTQAIIEATAVALEAARGENIHRASESLFEQAVTENMEADEFLAKEKFDTARDTSLTARDTLEEARAEARRLAALIAEQNRLIEELKARALQMKATNAVPEVWQENVEFHQSISMTFAEGYYTEVFEDNKELIGGLRDLLVLIEEKKQEAIRELAEAERTIDQLKTHRVKVDEEISRLNKEYQGN